MTDFVTVSQTPDGLVTATLWLDSIYLLRLSSRATNVQASFTTEAGLAPICTATGQMGPANKNCPDGMGLISLRCYSIACTGPLNGADAAAGGAAIFETSVTADFSICPPTQPNCNTLSAVSDTIRLRSPAITSGAARTSSSVRTSASQTSTNTAPTAQTTTSKPTTATRNTANQSTSPTASTSNTPANPQSDANSNSAGGNNSVGMGVGIAVGVVVLAAIIFGVFRHRSRTERRKQRLARLSTISHTYPVAFTSAPRPPKKDGPSSAWNHAQPVGLTALEREAAAETLARGGVDPISHQEQSVVMSQVYAAGHGQQQPLTQQPQQQQQQQQQVYAQYVVPQQMQPQQPQQAYVYPPTANTAQYPGYYDANGQYHFFNNQGPTPSH
ncbi:hypothetical protein BJ741DRAFT_603615, partial [Chytriomyces cf. hyalinus JEL632]